jgi:hypothetical protein
MCERDRREDAPEEGDRAMTQRRELARCSICEHAIEEGCGLDWGITQWDGGVVRVVLHECCLGALPLSLIATWGGARASGVHHRL